MAVSGFLSFFFKERTQNFVRSLLLVLRSLLKDKSLCVTASVHYRISVLPSKRNGKRQAQPPQSAIEPDKV